MTNTFSNLTQQNLLLILNLMKGSTIESVIEQDDGLLLTLAAYSDSGKNTWVRAIKVNNDGSWDSPGSSCLTDEEMFEITSNHTTDGEKIHLDIVLEGGEENYKKILKKRNQEI